MITPHPPQSGPSPTAARGPEQVRAGWDRIAAGFDEHVTSLNIGFADTVLGQFELAGTRFLDVAAGSGALAIPAARRGAEVLATDISPAMIERVRARARDEGLANLDARIMDGHALELDDDTFDVAASLNGVSLFGDIDRGLRELARVTRPGGRVLIIAFGPFERAEFLTFFLGALRAAVPRFTGPPMDPPPLPFQIADPDLLVQKLTGAGLSDVRVQRAIWEMPVRSAAHLWDLVTSSNPIGAQLVADLTSGQTADTRRVLDGMLRERSGGSPDAVLYTELNVGVGIA